MADNDNALAAVLSAAEQEPRELPRLICAQVFIIHAQIGSNLKAVAESYNNLPKVNSQAGLDEELKNIERYSLGIVEKVRRLLEANK